MDRLNRSRMIVLAGLAFCLVSLIGCNWPELVDNLSWQKQFRQPFTTLNPEDESVAQVDVATIVWRRDQPMIQGSMWDELDEQFISLEMRKSLAQHGLRVGLMRSAVGSRLQAALTNPEYTKEAQQQSSELVHQQVELDGRFIDVPKTVPVCTVEARRQMNRSEQDIVWPVGPRGGKACLLVPDAEKDYAAREVSQLELNFMLQLHKLPDGQTRLRLVPSVKCALGNTGQSNVFLDSLKLKNAVNKLEQRYEKLAIEVMLSQDQYLVVTATRPERVAPVGEVDAQTWGDLALVNYENDQQTVLVFRGASVLANRAPQAPGKGNAWPLAWQARELRAVK